MTFKSKWRPKKGHHIKPISIFDHWVIVRKGCGSPESITFEMLRNCSAGRGLDQLGLHNSSNLISYTILLTS